MWKKIIYLYHRLGSPKEFYFISGKFVPWISALCLMLMGIGTYMAFFTAPKDYQQGESFRIIYVHVPAAWMSLFIYMCMAVSAIGGFIWRIKTAFMVCICSAPIGATMTAIALITGSLWGKPMWGTWWVWDARLTSELILLFLYIGVIVLYNAFEDKSLGQKASALLSIVGAINVPIIHYSVVWWNSLHQGSTVIRSGGPAMPASMLIPLLIMAVAFNVFYLWVLLLRMRNHILQEKIQSSWVKSEVLGEIK